MNCLKSINDNTFDTIKLTVKRLKKEKIHIYGMWLGNQVYNLKCSSESCYVLLRSMDYDQGVQWVRYQNFKDTLTVFITSLVNGITINTEEIDSVFTFLCWHITWIYKIRFSYNLHLQLSLTFICLSQGFLKNYIIKL